MGCASSLLAMMDPGLKEGQRYWISPQNAPGKVLGCAGKGTTNGTKIVLWEKLEACPDQEWTFKKTKIPGTFLISPCHCNLQLDIPNPKEQAHLWEPNAPGADPNKNQVFAVVAIPNEAGWFIIKRPEGNLTLDVSGSGTDNGTAIIGWTEDTKGANQKFSIKPIPTLDVQASYHITPKFAPSKVFGCAGGDSTNGTKIVLWEKDGSDNQKWKAHHHGGSVYSFAPCHAPGQRMDNPAAAEQNHLWDTSVNNNPNQLWTLMDAGQGFFFLKASGNRVLDVKESKDENGAVVYTWTDFHKGPNQQFQFVKV